MIQVMIQFHFFVEQLLSPSQINENIYYVNFKAT